MKKNRKVISIAICLMSILALILITYITGFRGVALDEVMTYQQYFDKMGDLEWMLFFVLVINAGLNLANLYFKFVREKS